MSGEYPEPFNPNPGKYQVGDRVINRRGKIGVIVEPKEISKYDPPASKWELVDYDGELIWVGNIWIKKL